MTSLKIKQVAFYTENLIYSALFSNFYVAVHISCWCCCCLRHLWLLWEYCFVFVIPFMMLFIPSWTLLEFLHLMLFYHPLIHCCTSWHNIHFLFLQLLPLSFWFISGRLLCFVTFNSFVDFLCLTPAQLQIFGLLCFHPSLNDFCISCHSSSWFLHNSCLIGWWKCCDPKMISVLLGSSCEKNCYCWCHHHLLLVDCLIFAVNI